ncbi:MAG: proline racemase family protein [Trueperaceae bacterium]
MRLRHVVTTYDYHHGQSTRILAAGIPPVLGKSMQQKQDNFARAHDNIRASLMLEPRGHKNMLGAVITPAVRPDAHLGVLFLHGNGYFDMCGDSAFSTAAAAVELGLVPKEEGVVEVLMDTVAGPLSARVCIEGGVVCSIGIENVRSYFCETQSLAVPSLGEITVDLAYGGLIYAFVEVHDLKAPALSQINRDELTKLGSLILTEAKERIRLTDPVTGKERGVDLVTLVEPLEGRLGQRVANFYAPLTMGRTPSGTGLSARMATMHAKGKLKVGEHFIHESVLGLEFTGTISDVQPAENSKGTRTVRPMIETRSYLMGIQQFIIDDDDPFKYGFSL